MRVDSLLVRYRAGYQVVDDAGATSESGSLLTSEAGDLVTQEGGTATGIEGFVNYPEDTLEESERKALATIGKLSVPRWQSRVGVEPTGTGDVPFTDWNVGDTITVPDQDGSPAAVRVIGLALSEDEAGHPIYEPTVGAFVPTLEERQSVTNRAMSAGTLGGRDPQAMPRALGRSSPASVVPGGGGTNGFTFHVAASDASDASKAAADYVCSGTADDVVINRAINATYAIGNGNGRVVLSEGEFDITSELDFVKVLEGCGGVTKMCTVLRVSASITGHVVWCDQGSGFDIDVDSGVTVGTGVVVFYGGLREVSLGGAGTFTVGVQVDGALSHLVAVDISQSDWCVWCRALDTTITGGAFYALGDNAILVNAGSVLHLSASLLNSTASFTGDEVVLNNGTVTASSCSFRSIRTNDTGIRNEGILAISACYFEADGGATGTTGIDNNGTMNTGAAAGCVFDGLATDIA